MRKTNGCFVAGSIAAILATMAPVLAGMAEGKELIGANRVQVSGSFAYTGGSWTPSAIKRQGPGTYSDFGVVGKG